MDQMVTSLIDAYVHWNHLFSWHCYHMKSYFSSKILFLYLTNVFFFFPFYPMENFLSKICLDFSLWIMIFGHLILIFLVKGKRYWSVVIFTFLTPPPIANLLYSIWMWLNGSLSSYHFFPGISLKNSFLAFILKQYLFKVTWSGLSNLANKSHTSGMLKSFQSDPLPNIRIYFSLFLIWLKTFQHYFE